MILPSQQPPSVDIPENSLLFRALAISVHCWISRITNVLLIYLLTVLLIQRHGAFTYTKAWSIEPGSTLETVDKSSYVAHWIYV